jgi:hypothetical protein
MMTTGSLLLARMPLPLRPAPGILHVKHCRLAAPAKPGATGRWS